MTKPAISDSICATWRYTETVTPFFYPLRSCWRVQVPANESETGKRVSKYFSTKKLAENSLPNTTKQGLSSSLSSQSMNGMF
jgi:hypothetical protein